MSETDLVTFGCRLNTYESEVMRAHAQKAGLSDVVIFNTCAVTGEAVRQARQAIRKTRRERPGAHIIVTGCAAQIDPQSFAAMSEVDQVIGNDEKMKPETFARDFGVRGSERVLVNDIMSIKETAGHLVAGFQDRARAFVQIQNGCDHRCTFCIIPYGRGNSRSVPMGDVVNQIRTLVESGYAEIVFTGVDITSYGADLPGRPSLGQLAAKVLKLVPGLKRLRLSSIDSIEVDEPLMRLIAEEERLMPHLHLSLQSGDNMILKRMKRRHLREQSIAFCQEARRLRPDMVFGADLIAGFPTETEEMFGNTMRLVDECGLTWLHVFPYSARPGTPAARMPQLDGPTIKDRAARLRAKGQGALAHHFATQIGSHQHILMETADMGRTRQFAPVRLVDSAHTAAGEILPVEITAHSETELQARCAA